MKMLSLAIAFLVVGAFATLSGCATLNAEKRAPMLGAAVEAGGETIHVLDLGPRDAASPPVVLIHGASVNLRDMEMSLGEALAADRRVIMVDRPGRGYSTRPEDGWRLDVQARLIRDAVAALGVERPVIVGQSLGGAVALAYALQFQEEMSGLVLLAGVSHEWPGGVAWYNKVSGWPVAGFLLRNLVLPFYGPLAARGGVEDSFAPDEAPENYYERSALYLLFRPSDFKSNAADLRHLKPQIIAMSARYGEIGLPTAIVTDLDDSTGSPDLHSRQLAQEIPGAALTLLPDTGHALHHAETARIVDIISAVTERE